MANATFNASLTFTPPASNTVSQAFNLRLAYSAVSMGTIDVAERSEAAITIPFGGAEAAQGVVVRNNLDVDVKLKINEANAVYELAPGGIFMHWAPKAAATTNLEAMILTPSKATITAGTIEYIVLGT